MKDFQAPGKKGLRSADKDRESTRDVIDWAKRTLKNGGGEKRNISLETQDIALGKEGRTHPKQYGKEMSLETTNENNLTHRKPHWSSALNKSKKFDKNALPT